MDDQATQHQPTNQQKDHHTHSRIEWVTPHALLHPERLDIAVKVLYANSLMGVPTHHSMIDAESLYLKHILFRTGGKEPGDEARKSSLESFKMHFIDLLHSMKHHGFSPQHPIPVSRKTGLILNGAHRLAAALSLHVPKIPIVYHDDLDGLSWNTDWFITQGFSPMEVDECVRTWVSLNPEHAGCIMLWPTLEAHWHEMESYINTQTPILYRRTLTLPEHSFSELVRDIYATDWGPIPGDNIERKVSYFANHPKRIRFLVVSSPRAGMLTTLKNELRKQYHSLVPENRYATLHTTDHIHETTYIADIMLNRINLHALMQRPIHGFRPAFLARLSEYHEKLKTLAISPNSCCIVGSSVLEAYGIRQATDLDFTVTHAIRQQLFTPGVTHLTPTLDVVAKDYPRILYGNVPAPTDNDLIRDLGLHIRIRGLKFATLDIVITRKQVQRRFKDMMDIGLTAKINFENAP